MSFILFINSPGFFFFPEYPSVIPQNNLITNHPIINITSNTALDDFCEGNNTDGLSWNTAHEIRDLIIIAQKSASFWSSFGLKNISRFLIISNCYIYQVMNCQLIFIIAQILGLKM